MQRKLRAAKKSIAKASSTKNGDKSLQPDLYHNVAAFSKSVILSSDAFTVITVVSKMMNISLSENWFSSI